MLLRSRETVDSSVAGVEEGRGGGRHLPKGWFSGLPGRVRDLFIARLCIRCVSRGCMFNLFLFIKKEWPVAFPDAQKYRETSAPPSCKLLRMQNQEDSCFIGREIKLHEFLFILGMGSPDFPSLDDPSPLLYWWVQTLFLHWLQWDWLGSWRSSYRKG